MCRLCTFARTDEGYAGRVAHAAAEDAARLEATRLAARDNPSVFSNMPEAAEACARFEPLVAFPNPNDYYQPMDADGTRLGAGWSHGWGRGIGFPPDGSLLVYAKAAERVPFSHEESFSYYIQLRVSLSALAITCAPPRFIVRADALKIEGTNLLTGERATHEFSFTFSHLSTERSMLTRQAAFRSDFYRKVLTSRHMHPTAASASPDAEGEFEHYLMTTPHFAPAPLLMLRSDGLGFESRFAFQNAVAGYLEEHLKGIANTPADEEPANE